MKVDLLGTEYYENYIVLENGFIHTNPTKKEIVFKTIEEESQTYYPGDEVYFEEEGITVKITSVQKIYPHGWRYVTDFSRWVEDLENMKQAKKLSDQIFKEKSMQMPKPYVKPKRWWQRKKD